MRSGRRKSSCRSGEGATRHFRIGLLVLGGCLLATPATAQLYRWTDAEGTVHYTADPSTIPAQFRGGVTLLSAPQARPAPALDTSAPVSLQVTPGSPITVEVRLNGTPLTLIVDTGADHTVISPAAIERAGLAGQTGRTIQVVGVTGTATATLVTLPLLDVAGARIGPLPVIVYPLPSPIRGGEGAVDGLLGRDVLDAFVLSVDTASGRATLTLR